jgi:hypothetical protein
VFIQKILDKIVKKQGSHKRYLRHQIVIISYIMNIHYNIVLEKNLYELLHIYL